MKYFLLALKGMAMGAADVVPGVSGGTIAFISGIYEELLDSISKINLKALKILFKEGLLPAWRYINGNFFFFLFLGIGISIFSLSKLVVYLLNNHPVIIWSFFFGLIVASIWVMMKSLKKWEAVEFIAIIVGTSIAYYITIAPPSSSIDTLWYLFLSGSIAICAMILPGISGAFILLLLGSYDNVMLAITEKDFKSLMVFVSGCIIGLLSFSRLLKYLFKHYKDATIALLMGFLIGSLNKVWPWKETISTRINSHGEEVPFIQKNVWPDDIVNDQIFYAIGLMIAGFVVLYVLDRLTPDNLSSK